MNLQELKKTVDDSIGICICSDPNKIPVLITLAEKSVGARASCGVGFAFMGIDWEHGQFRIEPDTMIVRLLEEGIAEEVTCEIIDGKKYYFCPNCESRIAKNDFYCRYCGQKLREDEW